MWDLNTKEVYRVSLPTAHLRWDATCTNGVWQVGVCVSVWRAFAPRCRSDCRNSRATPQLWRPCASPPHDLLTATASIFSPGQRTIDCSVFGECAGGRHDCQISSSRWPCLFAFPAFTDLIFFSLHRQVREDGKDKNSVVSFALTDEPRHIDLIASKSREEVRSTSHCIQFVPSC